jgi:serine protease Do
MEHMEDIVVKTKKNFYNSVVLSVFISIIVVIIIAGLSFLVLWSYRMDIVNLLVKEYRAEQKKTEPVTIPVIEQLEDKEVKEESIVLPEAPALKIEEPTIINAVKKAKPAVVSILVTNNITNKKIGNGSGFLISADGLIVTNRHVVFDKDGIFTVMLNDGKEYKAVVLDRDPVLDVALMKIEGYNLPYLNLSDSDLLEVGETVIAIGNALGEFKNTVSAGVVSGLSRSITAGDRFGQREYLDEVIQTDAAINKGNSGGPLLNIYGDVVGINVAMVENSSSIGFSLPINSVKDVIESVKKTGKIIRPYLGVRYILLNKSIQEKNELAYDYGVWLVKGDEDAPAILPNSPAEEAGLKEGDIVLEIDGNKISTEKDFSYIIRNKKIGDYMLVKVYSGGLTKTIAVFLEQAPSDL